MKNLPQAASWDELRSGAYYGRWPERGERKPCRAVTADEVMVPSKYGESCWYCSVCGMGAETRADAARCCSIDDPRMFMPVFTYTVYTQEERDEIERLVFAGLTPKMIAEEMGKVHQDEVSAPYQAARRKVMKAKGLLTAEALKRWQDKTRKAAQRG